MRSVAEAEDGLPLVVDVIEGGIERGGTVVCVEAVMSDDEARRETPLEMRRTNCDEERTGIVVRRVAASMQRGHSIATRELDVVPAVPSG